MPIKSCDDLLPEQQQGQTLVLQARAGLIAEDDTPAVWTARMPQPHEIHELYRILTDRLPVYEAVNKLVAAIQRADKYRGGPTFKDVCPKTMGDLETIQRLNRIQ
jgi:hypothetical protein